MPCGFCGQNDCMRCRRATHLDVLEILNRLEQAIAKADRVDYTGVCTDHMRAVWSARDQINELLNHPVPVSR